MSEKEKKIAGVADAEEMDAAEMLKRHRERFPEEQTETTEEWAAELIREFDAAATAWHHRQGWEAFGIGCYHGLVALSCVGGLLCGYQWLVLAGIGISSLIMMGGWFHKAKAGWSA